MPANAGVVPVFFLKAFIAIFHFVKMMVNFKKEYSLMNEKLQKVLEFLDDAQTYYLATVEGDQPRVRPFGTALVYNDRLYIQTGKIKAVSKQISSNPKVEICAFKDGKWIRITGELVEDDTREVKTLMLDKMPVLRHMYNEDDGNMQMLYFKSTKVVFVSFGSAPEEFDI